MHCVYWSVQRIFVASSTLFSRLVRCMSDSKNELCIHFRKITFNLNVSELIFKIFKHQTSIFFFEDFHLRNVSPKKKKKDSFAWLYYFKLLPNCSIKLSSQKQQCIGNNGLKAIEQKMKTAAKLLKLRMYNNILYVHWRSSVVSVSTCVSYSCPELPHKN